MANCGTCANSHLYTCGAQVCGATRGAMEKTKVVVFNVLETGDVLSPFSDAPVATLAEHDLEYLSATMAMGPVCHVLPASFDPYFPGRGRSFLVNPIHLISPKPVADGKRAVAAVVRFAADAFSLSLGSLAEAYGLSELERRLAVEIASNGKQPDLDNNATARNALMRLRRKLGTPNLAGTVTHLLELLSDLPTSASGIDQDAMAFILGLPPRRFQIAGLVAGGMSRTEVSVFTGRSVALVKAELSLAYELFEVQTASQLAAIIGQARIIADEVLSVSARQTHPEDWGRHAVIERDDGRKVGYSLYGRPGYPLIHITHSNITCRHPPTRLVSRLVRDGYQVLTVDRPGYGDTCKARVSGIDAHIETALEDLLAVMERERLEKFILLARSSVQIAISYANSIPERIEGVLCVNAVPPAERTTSDKGPLGALKRRFIRYPASIRLLIGTLLKLATIERLRSSARRSMAGSAPDLAALDDPLVMEDYLASCLPLKDCLDGYILEVSEWAKGWEPTPSHQGQNWTILLGAHYVLHDPRITADYLAKSLPEATIRIVRDGGTMLAWSHPDVIADALCPPMQ